MVLHNPSFPSAANAKLRVFLVISSAHATRLVMASSGAPETETTHTQETRRFYDELASSYTSIFADFEGTLQRQAGVIAALLQAAGVPEDAALADVAAGIGTQALGLAAARAPAPLVATDLSPAAVARLAAAAKARGITNLVAAEADMTSAPADTPEALVAHAPFGAVLAFDNALPHLPTRAALKAAAAFAFRLLAPGGVYAASVRDYDTLRETRPTGETPRVMGARGCRRMVTQAWAWEDGPEAPSYRLNMWVLQEAEASGRWEVVSYAEGRYTAWLRDDIAAAFAAAGFERLEWQMPSTTGFYQPILLARRPSLGE